MGNLIKNELKGSYKYILGFLTIIVLANIYFIFKFSGSYKDPINVVASFLCGLATMVGVFITSIAIFRRDIYGNTGYLMFTLPKSSYSIIAYKMLVSLIYYLIFSVLSIGMFLINMYYSLTEKDFYHIMNRILEKKPDCILVYLTGVLIFLIVTMLVYFSIVIAKSILKTNKFKRLISFIIFLITVYVIAKGHELLEKSLPNVFLNNSLSSSINYGLGDMNLMFEKASLGNLIFDIIVFLILFITSGYLMENKMDI